MTIIEDLWVKEKLKMVEASQDVLIYSKKQKIQGEQL